VSHLPAVVIHFMDIPLRDLEGLAFIGRGYEVAQYQVHGAVFAGRAPTVVSRFVKRWAVRKIIAVERLNRTGVNRLRLTSSGRSLLVASGVRAVDLFAPRRPTALKDLAHVLWINDLRVAVSRLSPTPDVALPAWSLQRRFGTALPVIPDFLAVWQPTEMICGGALACEIDLGGESIRGVLQPKLVLLRRQLNHWAAGSPSIGVVFTASSRRAAAIDELTSQREPAISVTSLPAEEGTARFDILRGLIQGHISSSFFQKPPRIEEHEVVVPSTT